MVLYFIEFRYEKRWICWDVIVLNFSGLIYLLFLSFFNRGSLLSYFVYLFLYCLGIMLFYLIFLCMIKILKYFFGWEYEWWVL